MEGQRKEKKQRNRLKDRGRRISINTRVPHPPYYCVCERERKRGRISHINGFYMQRWGVTD